jgi:hypothetical protein
MQLSRKKIIEPRALVTLLLSCIFSVCLAQPATCDIQRIPNIQNKLLIDKRTHYHFILDTTQTTIEARRKNGDLIWRTNPWKDNYIPFAAENHCPCIVIFQFANDWRTNNHEVIMISYNSTLCGYLDKQNGRFTLLGQD